VAVAFSVNSVCVLAGTTLRQLRDAAAAARPLPTALRSLRSCFSAATSEGIILHSLGYQSTRHTVKSSHGQVVTRSTRHGQLVTNPELRTSQVVTRSTRHTEFAI